MRFVFALIFIVTACGSTEAPGDQRDGGIDANDGAIGNDAAAFMCPPEQGEEPPPPILGPSGCEEQPRAIPPSVETATVNGSEFLYQASPNSKGLIIIFHGGGGSKESATSRVEVVLFFNDAMDAGYSVAALDSAAHLEPPPDGKFKWNEDASSCNPDIVNVVEMIKRLKDPNDLAAADDETPIFGLGISNGGSMVSRAAQHIDFSAVATYITNAQEFHEEDAHIPPVIIIAGENDSTVGTRGPCLLWDISQANEIVASFHLNFVAKLSPGLFTRIPAIDCSLSQDIYTSFESNGVIDDAGAMLIDPNIISNWRPYLPNSANPSIAQIRDLLLERSGAHSFPSEFNNETLDFFEANARPNPVSELSSCP